MEYKPEIGDIIVYTCGRKRFARKSRTLEKIIFEACADKESQKMSEICSLICIKNQIISGDVSRIIRNNNIIYMKNSEFPKLESGMRIKFGSDKKLGVVAYNGSGYYAFDYFGNIFTIHGQKASYDVYDYEITTVYDKFLGVKPFEPHESAIIWKKLKYVELTMDEIAEKFGIDVDLLKIKK